MVVGTLVLLAMGMGVHKILKKTDERPDHQVIPALEFNTLKDEVSLKCQDCRLPAKTTAETTGWRINPLKGEIDYVGTKKTNDFFSPSWKAESAKILALSSLVIIAFLASILGILSERSRCVGHNADGLNPIPTSNSTLRLPTLADFRWLFAVIVWQTIVLLSFLETVLAWIIWGSATKHPKSTVFLVGLLIVKASSVAITGSTLLWIGYSVVLNSLLHFYSILK